MLLQESCWSDGMAGELQSIDGYMNLALEKCEEHVDGVKKRSYGDAFVRGNNGEYAHLRAHSFANLYSYVHLSRLKLLSFEPRDMHSKGVQGIQVTASGVGIVKIRPQHQDEGPRRARARVSRLE